MPAPAGIYPHYYGRDCCRQARDNTSSAPIAHHEFRHQ
jgi:hypothetical protein